MPVFFEKAQHMATYLKIENPGVCPTEGFILLGATSKRLADNDSPFTVGCFGSGTKLSTNLLLRVELYPVVFCGNHKLEFTTKAGRMKALEGDAAYNRVVVKLAARTRTAPASPFTEELSQTDEYGASTGIAWEWPSGNLSATPSTRPSRSTAKPTATSNSRGKE